MRSELVALLAGLTLLSIGTFATRNYAADESLLAYRLFDQGKYAQAAEIFTDPAWKGIALYRSSQWWRAAEAFVRANDPVSAYNLGNSYVQLGYYALALEAYQRALTLNPLLEDAQHNADIMRALLTQEREENQRGGKQPDGKEIDQLDVDSPPEEKGNSDTGEKSDIKGDNAPGESTDDGQPTIGTDQEAQAGKGSDAGDQEPRPETDDTDGSGAINGEPDDTSPEAGRPSGGSDTEAPSTESAAAGLRTSLETEQATTQWLNRIEHDSQLFLQRRLRLEQRRRNAAGQAPPQGGSSW